MADAEREDAGREVVTRHHGPWSEADYRALGGSDVDKPGGRVELVDGALVIGPGPTADGERAVGHVRAALAEALPDGLCVVGPVALRMGPDCVLVPDLVVMRADDAASAAADAPDADAPANAPADAGAAADPGAAADANLGAPADANPGPQSDAVVDAEEVLMVVEIVGPEHGAVDRTLKPLLYARARLPYLLIVDWHVPFASASMVISGRYHEYARASGPDELELEEPFRLRLLPPEK